MAGLSPDSVVPFAEHAAVPAAAAHPLLTAAAALHHFRSGERTPLLLAHESESCACAVIFDCEQRDPQ